MIILSWAIISQNENMEHILRNYWKIVFENLSWHMSMNISMSPFDVHFV